MAPVQIFKKKRKQSSDSLFLISTCVVWGLVALHDGAADMQIPEQWQAKGKVRSRDAEMLRSCYCDPWFTWLHYHDDCVDIRNRDAHVLSETPTHTNISYYPCKDLLLILLLMQLINVIRHLNLIRNIFFLCGFCIKKKKISFPYGDPRSKFSDIHVLVRMFGLL